MITLLVHLAAAVALLLWSVRLIRTGVERAFLPELRRGLKALSRHSVSAAAAGGLAAMLLQSSTAVALIGGGFAASGMLAPAAALALLLGADLGSALMARILLVPVEDWVPFILLAGILTFFNARGRRSKQVGRIVTGFALVLLSLEMIRNVTDPVASNEIVQSIAAHFANDLGSAFAIGAVLAWLMHSSLAAVLTFATFAASGMIAAPVAAALIIGANLGGAVVPVMLLLDAPRPTRLVVVGNLIARTLVSFTCLALLVGGRLDLTLLGTSAGAQAVHLHIVVNAALLCLALPATALLIRAAEMIVPDQEDDQTRTDSALDLGALDRPQVALACAQRELMRMAEVLQSMLTPVVGLFRDWDPLLVEAIERREDEIDRMHYETKLYVSRMRDSRMSPDQARRAVEIVAMANSLEEAADRVAVNLLGLARKMHTEGISFSEQGYEDIQRFHDQIVTNMQLSLNVLTTGDSEAARQLVAEKDRIRREEQTLQERHLARLREGGQASVETTNIHQETLRLLKHVNAAISYMAYPIAEETGDLLDTRLARPAAAGGPA